MTFARPEDAVAAIKSLNDGALNGGQQSFAGKMINGQQQGQPCQGGRSTPTLRASLGTTKYCTHWLRAQTCPKLPDCMYLHELAEQEASFTKEEMQLGKHNEYEKRLINHYWNLIQQREREKEKKRHDSGQVTSGQRSRDSPVNVKSVKNSGSFHSSQQKIVDMVFVNGQLNGDDTSNDSVSKFSSIKSHPKTSLTTSFKIILNFTQILHLKV